MPPKPTVSRVYYCMNLTYQIVRALFQNDSMVISRNKAFESFGDPVVRRAVRLHRLLRSVEVALLGIEVEHLLCFHVRSEENNIVIHWCCDNSVIKSSRTATLPQPEWDLLMERDDVAKKVAALIQFTTVNKSLHPVAPSCDTHSLPTTSA